MLITFIRDLRDVLDSRIFRREFEVDGQECPQIPRTNDHTGASGRPRYAITESQIRMLRQEGFRWADIARYFGVYPITLRTKSREYELPVGEKFDHISNDELDTLVARVLHDTRQAGFNLVHERARGLRLQRERIRYSMLRVDPISSTLRNFRRVVRRTYSAPCPNALW